MELSLLKSLCQSLGATNDQIETYIFLFEHGALSPPKLAELSDESRGSAYMALKKLEELGLATRQEVSKKLVYKAVSPARIELLLRDREQDLKAARKDLQSKLPDLLATYYRNAQSPGLQFYEGREGLKKVYEDHLKTGQDIYFVRTAEDINESYLSSFVYDYMDKCAKAGITVYGLAPNYPSAVAWSKKNDKKLRRKTTWYDPAQYSAPVEISVYGNKVAFINFGEEIVATVIESPQIATAMRDMFVMAQAGARPRGRLGF